MWLVHLDMKAGLSWGLLFGCTSIINRVFGGHLEYRADEASNRGGLAGEQLIH